MLLFLFIIVYPFICSLEFKAVDFYSNTPSYDHRLVLLSLYPILTGFLGYFFFVRGIGEEFSLESCVKAVLSFTVLLIIVSSLAMVTWLLLEDPLKSLLYKTQWYNYFFDYDRRSGESFLSVKVLCVFYTLYILLSGWSVWKAIDRKE
ncbi:MULTISPECIES: hypothetical protein [unclassified Dysgonomonas]|uniref:hypothetical protein n=1 Tax=unclassified Dysgonomonas TaxID=2630389 RepID=UPI0024767334|nr:MULTISPECIES: hypothetical protein [unclassified Dysgonomonas]